MKQTATIMVMVPIAILAGVASGFVMDITRGKFDRAPAPYANPTKAESEQYNRERQAALRWSTAVSTAAAGAIIAGLFGLSQGLLLGSALRSALGLLLGGMAGLVFVGLGGMVGQHYYAVISVSSREPSQFAPMLLQLTYWLPQVLAVALAGAIRMPWRAALKFLGLHLLAAIFISGVTPVLWGLLLILADKNSKDTIPPETVAHCLAMTLTGTIVFGLVGTLFDRRYLSAANPLQSDIATGH